MHTIAVTDEIIAASNGTDMAVLVTADGTQFVSQPDVFRTKQGDTIVASIVGHAEGNRWVTTQGFPWNTHTVGEIIEALHLTRGDWVLLGDRRFKFDKIKGGCAIFRRKKNVTKIPLDANEQLVATGC